MFGYCSVVGLLFMAMVAGPVIAAADEADAGLDAELRAFMQRAAQAAPRTSHSFSAQLADIPSGDGRRIASPQIELVAGRIDSHHCLYQLRLKVRWSGRVLAGTAAADDGRSVLSRAECSEIAREVSAVALREVSALRQQLRGSGLRVARAQSAAAPAIGAPVDESSAVDAAAVLAAATIAMPDMPMWARVGKARLDLRVSPHAKAPLMQRIAPGTELQLMPSGEPGWFALGDRAGFVSAAGLVYSAEDADSAQQISDGR